MLGAAHLAVLKIGGILLGLDGQAVPGEKKGNEFLTEKIGGSTGAVNLKIRRGQGESVITLHPLQTCSFPVFLAANDAVNALTAWAVILLTLFWMCFWKVQGLPLGLTSKGCRGSYTRF